MPHRGLESASVLRLAFQSNALPAELLPPLCARPEMSLEPANSVQVLDWRNILDETINPFKVNVALRPETTRTIRDGEPRTATSTFTQLLSTDYKPGEAPRFDTHVRRPHTHVKNRVVHVRVRWVIQTSRSANPTKLQRLPNVEAGHGRRRRRCVLLLTKTLSAFGPTRVFLI